MPLCLVRSRQALSAERGTVPGTQPCPRRVDQLTEPLSLEQREGTFVRAGGRTGEGRAYLASTLAIESRRGPGSLA